MIQQEQRFLLLPQHHLLPLFPAPPSQSLGALPAILDLNERILIPELGRLNAKGSPASSWSPSSAPTWGQVMVCVRPSPSHRP